MTALLERPRPRPAAPRQPVHEAQPHPRPAGGTTPHVTVIGDFNCPWSYLAFRRAAILAVAGVSIDWLAVEHAPSTPGRQAARDARLAALQAEMELVIDELLPGERLPYDLAGFVPRTRAAVAAYAEACAAGVGDVARRMIFQSFWMHGIDIGDPGVLRILMIDELRSGAGAGEPVREEWGYPVDVTGPPISTDGWRLVRRWAEQWHGLDVPVVPAVRMGGEEPVLGVAAVRWLGDAILARGLELDLPPGPTQQAPSCRALPALVWVTENGGQWLPRCRQRPVSPYHQAG